ncbi:MAG: DUF4115 domain-containing protein [Endomicrobium sp.]|jgi:cytoskeletal protein RodZ|nr:DUF4115 domain-containing protein [Endomicrobium sp.]
MKELGKILKEKRKELSLDLEKVHAATKIQEKYISAIEEGDKTVFTAEIYYKSFVKSYSKFLGFNGIELLIEYEKRKCDKNEEENCQQNKNGRKSQKSIKERGSDLKKLFATVLVAGILFATFLYLSKNISVLTEDTDKILDFKQKKIQFQKIQELQMKQEHLEYIPQKVISTEEENKNKELNPFPKEQQSAQAKNDTKTALSERKIQEKQELVINAVENVWIKVEGDGREIFQGTIVKGTKKEWKANNDFVVNIGYTPGATIYFNGDEINAGKGAVNDVNMLVLKRRL